MPMWQIGARCFATADSKVALAQIALVATPTLADPGRAPEGCHTVKILSPQTYRLPGGMGDWDSVKEAHAGRLLAQLRQHAPGGDVAVMGSR